MKDLSNTSLEGTAALSICESLLIALRDLKIMSQKDARDVLQDAATAHHEASSHPDHAAMHKGVATLIDKILAGGNSLPRI